MNKYIAPALEEVKFVAVDVLMTSEGEVIPPEETTSGESTGGEEYETPIG